MLSKEEIEYMKKFFNECITKDLINSEDLAIRFMNVALEYIGQLETREQKLIEKLEEDIENSNKGMDTNIILIKEYYKNKKEYAQEILSILKGENQVTVK